MYYNKFLSRMLPAFLASMVIGLFILLSPYSPALAQGGWEIGKTTGLRAGTCIREGPGFSYLAHTRVPEDNWAVMIIDGPRTADGHIWWDTSRKAAGDPSGGTGWVTQDQTDTDSNIPAVNVPTVPQASRIADQSLLHQVRSWWYQQSALIKWGAAILLLLALRFLWRQWGSIVIGLISALFSAVVIWIVLI